MEFDVRPVAQAFFPWRDRRSVAMDPRSRFVFRRTLKLTASSELRLAYDPWLSIDVAATAPYRTGERLFYATDVPFGHGILLMAGGWQAMLIARLVSWYAKIALQKKQQPDLNDCAEAYGRTHRVVGMFVSEAQFAASR